MVVLHAQHVIDTAAAERPRDIRLDFAALRVEAHMHLAPHAPLARAVLTHFPLAFTEHFEAGRIDHDRQRFFRTGLAKRATWNSDPQRFWHFDSVARVSQDVPSTIRRSFEKPSLDIRLR